MEEKYKYKVQVHVRQEARIIGLNMQMFYVFLIVGILAVFILFSELSFFKILGVIVLLSVTYIVLVCIQNVDFNKYFGSLPKKLDNR